MWCLADEIWASSSRRFSLLRVELEDEVEVGLVEV